MNEPSIAGPPPPAIPMSPLPVHEPEATVFGCALCGSRFTHGGRVCGSCPMSTGCDLVKCPHCGFQFPRSSHIAEALSRLWKRVRGKVS